MLSDSNYRDACPDADLVVDVLYSRASIIGRITTIDFNPDTTRFAHRFGPLVAPNLFGCPLDVASDLSAATAANVDGVVRYVGQRHHPRSKLVVYHCTLTPAPAV